MFASDMAYGAFKEVSSSIAEREYCIGGEITTTAVTSCIVVASLVGSKLFGIHLSIFGEDSAFGPDDADEVGKIMRNKGVDMGKIRIFGEIDFWGPSIPGYSRLMTVLGNPPQHQKSGNITITKADVG
jgi:hypothetical protein